MLSLALLAFSVSLKTAGDQPKVELLWPKGTPGAIGEEERDKPTLTIYLPSADKANGTAIVVCPGGGYGALAVGHEGKEPAEWLNRYGIAAFVLRYRLGPRYRHPAPMQDVQRALRLVRSRAKEWHVEPHRIGIWGFSAGGHLASTAATHFDDGKPDSGDPLERISCRPDFAILCYPVITLRPPFTHGGSRRNLLGDKPDEALVASLCNDEQVTEKTPPTFLFHTNEDTAVPPENSILFYQALRKKKVPAELHIYEKGTHGIGLGVGRGAVSAWPEQLAGWLKTRGLLTSERR
jgi:acetyl esterase/lipase